MVWLAKSCRARLATGTIFNSCDGLGLARQLNDLNIPQMIVMRELVPDRVAQAFMTHFLTRFSEGEPFYLAVREYQRTLAGT
uniref:CHAT domain-containing protein n=1 Tax=Desertifilum tharense IPPAS B-1220 TaxID=1781255 RepID=A0ACD5GMU6_9CYAN